MLAYSKIILVCIMLSISMQVNGNKKRDNTYIIGKDYQSFIQAVNVTDTPSLSSTFSNVPSPYIVIFIPTDKVRDTALYSDTILTFLKNFSLSIVDAKQIASSQVLFFLMTQTQDGKSSTKRTQGEQLGQFIQWLYSYNRNSTIILISDRNGSAIVNCATYTLAHPLKTTGVHTIIQLYPTVPLTAAELSQELYKPNSSYYKNLFVIYSDHVNTFTTKKGQKQYPTGISHYSYLLLKNNEQVAPEIFLSPFCAKRLWLSLTKASTLYPHHKNFIAHWSSTRPDLDQILFLKDNELSYPTRQLPKSNLLGLSSTISTERITSETTKQKLEKKLTGPLKITLPFSEQSKHFYNSLAPKKEDIR